MHSHTVLEARCPKPKCWQGCVPFTGLQRESFPVSPRFRWLQVFLGCDWIFLISASNFMCKWVSYLIWLHLKSPFLYLTKVLAVRISVLNPRTGILLRSFTGLGLCRPYSSGRPCLQLPGVKCWPSLFLDFSSSYYTVVRIKQSLGW